mmetsp:Transcript_13356/g.49982  ORF Transcript_13356/g.49982 Transcript_13356/m.49982 type:complete len:233 (+) Transcript_13356:680-1378(+)
MKQRHRLLGFLSPRLTSHKASPSTSGTWGGSTGLGTRSSLNLATASSCPAKRSSRRQCRTSRTRKPRPRRTRNTRTPWRGGWIFPSSPRQRSPRRGVIDGLRNHQSCKRHYHWCVCCVANLMRHHSRPSRSRQHSQPHRARARDARVTPEASPSTKQVRVVRRYLPSLYLPTVHLPTEHRLSFSLSFPDPQPSRPASATTPGARKARSPESETRRSILSGGYLPLAAKRWCP